MYEYGTVVVYGLQWRQHGKFGGRPRSSIFFRVLSHFSDAEIDQSRFSVTKCTAASIEYRNPQGQNDTVSFPSKIRILIIWTLHSRHPSFGCSMSFPSIFGFVLLAITIHCLCRSRGQCDAWITSSTSSDLRQRRQGQPCNQRNNRPRPNRCILVAHAVIPGSSSGTGSTSGGGLFGRNSGNAAAAKAERTEGVPPKSVLLLELPAEAIKLGALRFLLQIHLVSEQNKPVPKAWLTREVDNNDDDTNDSKDNKSTLQVYFMDGTGMLSMELSDAGISIQRLGDKPSLQYVLQESILLHSILDQLEEVVFGDTADEAAIDVDKRLLILSDATAIDQARANLPARNVA